MTAIVGVGFRKPPSGVVHGPPMPPRVPLRFPGPSPAPQPPSLPVPAPPSSPGPSDGSSDSPRGSPKVPISAGSGGALKGGGIGRGTGGGGNGFVVAGAMGSASDEGGTTPFETGRGSSSPPPPPPGLAGFGDSAGSAAISTIDQMWSGIRSDEFATTTPGRPKTHRYRKTPSANPPMLAVGRPSRTAQRIRRAFRSMASSTMSDRMNPAGSERSSTAASRSWRKSLLASESFASSENSREQGRVGAFMPTRTTGPGLSGTNRVTIYICNACVVGQSVPEYRARTPRILKSAVGAKAREPTA